MASMLPVSPQVRDYVVRSLTDPQIQPNLQEKLQSTFYYFDKAQEHHAISQSEISVDEAARCYYLCVTALSEVFPENTDEIKQWFLTKVVKEYKKGKPPEFPSQKIMKFLEKLKGPLLSHQQKLDKHAAILAATEQAKFDVVADTFDALAADAGELAEKQLQAQEQIARLEAEIAKAQEQDRRGAEHLQKVQDVSEEVNRLAEALDDLEAKDAAAGPKLEQVEEAQASQEVRADVNVESARKNLIESRELIQRQIGELEAERAGLWASACDEENARRTRNNALMISGCVTTAVGGAAVPITGLANLMVFKMVGTAVFTSSLIGAPIAGVASIALLGLGVTLIALWQRDVRRMQEVEAMLSDVYSKYKEINKKIAKWTLIRDKL